MSCRWVKEVPPNEGEKDGQTMSHTLGESVTLSTIWCDATNLNAIEIEDIDQYLYINLV